MNLTILRENIEDTYGGIEFMHTPEVAVSYRIITKPGSEQFLLPLRIRETGRDQGHYLRAQG